MIGIPAALIVGGVLLLSLLLLAARNVTSAHELASRSDNASLLDDLTESPPCPAGFVARIFDPCDWQFVSEIKSPQLHKFFHRERKDVALVWVRQTATAIRRIMHDHTEAARQSEDLNFATETRLVLLYAELMLLCGVLFLAIQASGPQRVRALAVYADTLSQRLAQAQQSLTLATEGRGLNRTGSP